MGAHHHHPQRTRVAVAITALGAAAAAAAAIHHALRAQRDAAARRGTVHGDGATTPPEKCVGCTRAGRRLSRMRKRRGSVVAVSCISVSSCHATPYTGGTARCRSRRRRPRRETLMIQKSFPIRLL